MRPHRAACGYAARRWSTTTWSAWRPSGWASGKLGDDAAATGYKTLSAQLVAEQGLLERAGAAPV